MTVNPDLWEQPTIRAGHPRLYVDGRGSEAPQARWRDPAYQAVVGLYRGKKDPLSRALQYLATGDAGLCHAAVPDALAEPYKLAGPSRAVYGDESSLVFDWCYGALSSGGARRARAIHRLAQRLAGGRAGQALPMA